MKIKRIVLLTTAVLAYLFITNELCAQPLATLVVINNTNTNLSLVINGEEKDVGARHTTTYLLQPNNLYSLDIKYRNIDLHIKNIKITADGGELTIEPGLRVYLDTESAGRQELKSTR